MREGLTESSLILDIDSYSHRQMEAEMLETLGAPIHKDLLIICDFAAVLCHYVANNVHFNDTTTNF